MRYQAFSFARRGYRPEENQDAFAADAALGRFAVADGASESGFAEVWARLLVEDFVQQGDVGIDRWTDRLPSLQEMWQAAVCAQPLPWWAKAKFQQGAFATFLGVKVADKTRTDKQPDGVDALETEPNSVEPAEVVPATKESGSQDAFVWEAVAVGDACLFHTRQDQLLRAFPLHRAEQFNNYPNLVGSRYPPEYVREKLSLFSAGEACSEDRLWLVTDALAQWCLARCEAGQWPWAEMAAKVSGGSSDWIKSLREAKQLRNDDVTLLCVVL